MVDLLNKHFNIQMSANQIFGKDGIKFGHLLSKNTEHYQEINDKNELLKVLGEKLDDYNNNNAS